MRHVLNVVVAAVASLLVVIGWKPILGLESFDADIEITALGTRNPQSKNAEVWVRLVDWPAGVTVDDFLRTARPKEGWEKRDIAAVSYQNQPARMSWRGKVGPEAKLSFVRHDWSGDMRIIINGSTKNYDLYAAGSSPDLVIRLKSVPAVFRDSLLSVPGTFLPAALLAIAALAIGYTIASRRRG